MICSIIEEEEEGDTVAAVRLARASTRDGPGDTATQLTTWLTLPPPRSANGPGPAVPGAFAAHACLPRSPA